MKIRLGYVSLAKTLDDITTSHTITYTNYIKNNYTVDKLIEITNLNLNSLKEILIYNVKNNFHFYRITSKLVPLATHKNVKFNYIKPMLKKYKEIGNIINKNKLRVDTHPDQFAVLNSINKEIVNNTIKILKYHYSILKAFNIKDKIIILHVGSSVFGKENSIKRFINNFNLLPSYLKNAIALENDDKIYNIKDVIQLCEKCGIPMVLDYHHYLCNNNGEKVEDYLKRIFNTWKKKIPKIHFSSPKNNSKKDFRSHNDYIDSDKFTTFLEILKKENKDVDIMLEAKAKDYALTKLVRELKYKTNYKFIDDSTFII